MKKLIFLAIFLPSFAFAQSVQDQYIASLQQVIPLLIQEVQLLEQQLTNWQQSQIQATTTPSPVFGGIATSTSVSTAPTCTLTSSLASVSANDGTNYITQAFFISWTSTNATRGTLLTHYPTSWGALNLMPVASGSEMMGTPGDRISEVKAKFVGDGGEVTCLPL